MHTGDSPKWVKSKRRRKRRREKERLNGGENNGQAMHGSRKPPGPKNRKTPAGNCSSGIPKISFMGAPEVGGKQCMEKERRKRERKSVLTLASYACERLHGW